MGHLVILVGHTNFCNQQHTGGWWTYCCGFDFPTWCGGMEEFPGCGWAVPWMRGHLSWLLAEVGCAGQQWASFRATKIYLGVTVRNSQYPLSRGLLAWGDVEDDCSVASVRNFSACIKCCVSAKIVFLSGLEGHPRTVRQRCHTH